MSNYIAIFAIFNTVILGLLAVVVPLYIRGAAERERFLHKKIEKNNAILHKRIDETNGSHVHEELCDERSGNIKKRVDSMSGGR